MTDQQKKKRVIAWIVRIMVLTLLIVLFASCKDEMKVCYNCKTFQDGVQVKTNLYCDINAEDVDFIEKVTETETVQVKCDKLLRE